ncbi:multidrug resistance-associated protein 1, 3 (mrp1, 3), abc-transoprter, putative [Ricinus communis]|uniref:ABC-type xenobiotic transporter n=1 Tax=Ricinus communis TaxID=3988 RepID=B9RCM1_RICCO|nr:multidrug resistance-associated protein 1, 3 (mrp1, 3), abc-transoprter, putative [Ricinus communis]
MSCYNTSHYFLDMLFPQNFTLCWVSLDRIANFLEEPELPDRNIRQKCSRKELNECILIKSTEISWDTTPLAKPALRNINLAAQSEEKVAICGEVGSGKSTLLAALLREVPKINEQYEEVLERCSLVKDLEMLPFVDQTQIGERGVNLSGGQKQRVQLARALYQDADIYLLDDPFSAVDAHTETILFNEYVIRALSGKTVLLVTHQVDLLPAFNSILMLSAGKS